MKSIFLGAGGLLLCGCLVASEAVAPGWVEIFDGRSLGGWASADMSYWSVRDGAITGTSKEPTASNHYLVWQRGKPADFELSLCFRIQGTPQANSGVQFRSKVQPNGFVEGYQADIARYAEHCGVLYDETPGRGLLAKRGQRLCIDETGQRVTASFANGSDLFKVVRLDDWNEYHIVARGSWVSARLNGSLVWQVVDRDASRRADEPGVIALQLHSGPPMMDIPAISWVSQGESGIIRRARAGVVDGCGRGRDAVQGCRAVEVWRGPQPPRPLGGCPTGPRRFWTPPPWRL
ncbi:MAG: DUF1080 domain-containing protein [Verrucomicrobiota bacterium]|nr:DUF1080 domain-containing protein [Verrucomicrobiota bacterium]